MADQTETLDQLEQRIGQRWAEATAAHIPSDPLDLKDWLASTLTDPQVYSSNLPQFPREQWVTYPPRRTVSLLLVDNALNAAEKLTESDWLALAFLMTHGGRERIA